MSKPIVMIDPGHGGKDPGGGSSVFWDKEKGFYEKDMVLQISLYQFQRLQQLGVAVAMTRTSDVYLSPDQRTAIVRQSGARYCMSNHVNAASSPAATGVEAIHSVHSSGELAFRLVQAIHQEGMPLRKTPIYSRKNSSGTDYYFMHRQTGAVATVIIEYGFATNPADAERLASDWKGYAEAALRAFCQFIGHAYSPPQSVKPTPPVIPDPPDDNAPIIDATQAIVMVDGKELIVKGEVKAGVTQVPVRALAEAMGFKVRWDQQTRTIFITQAE